MLSTELANFYNSVNNLRYKLNTVSKNIKPFDEESIITFKAIIEECNDRLQYWISNYNWKGDKYE